MQTKKMSFTLLITKMFGEKNSVGMADNYHKATKGIILMMPSESLESIKMPTTEESDVDGDGDIDGDDMIEEIKRRKERDQTSPEDMSIDEELEKSIEDLAF